MTVTDDKLLQSCALPLCHWYTENRRAFPWRETSDPYAVWLSEIMLQQTRIEAALPYYRRFLETLPTVQALAEAEESVILKLWEGLGYYSRVRNMQKAARQIVDCHGGVFPEKYEDIKALAGIGEYTAGAIASICFGQPTPAVDGNVLRVLSRLYNDRTDVMLASTKKHASQLIEQVLPSVPYAGDFNQGIMELGERICLPNGTPLCDSCPLAAQCAAHAAGTETELPVRTVKTKRRLEHRTVLLCFSDEPVPRILLHQRPDTGLLAGLWELPSVLMKGTQSTAENAVFALGANRAEMLSEAQGKHLFSHLEWRMNGYAFRTDPFSPPNDAVWVTQSELAQSYALPSAFRPFSELIQTYLQEETV